MNAINRTAIWLFLAIITIGLFSFVSADNVFLQSDDNLNRGFLTVGCSEASLNTCFGEKTRWNISSVSGSKIQDAQLCFYKYSTTGVNRTQTNTSIDTGAWNLNTDPSYKNSSILAWIGISDDSYNCLNVTNLVQQEATKSNVNITFYVNDGNSTLGTVNTGSGSLGAIIIGQESNNYSFYRSSGYSNESQRPYLNISFLNQILVTSPSFNEVFDTTAIFNVTNSEQMDVCYTTLDSVNYTMTDVGSGTSWGYTNTTLPEGNSTVEIQCNATGDGTWYISESISFAFDSLSPEIDFTASNDVDNLNISRNYTLINISYTEANLENITYYIYNSTGLLDSQNYPNATTTHNFTGLDEGTYTYNVTIWDMVDNTNKTDTRTITIDTVIPSLSLTRPEAITYSTNETLPLNYTVSDVTTNVEECWYNVVNSTGDTIISNTTIASCTNTTFDLAQGDGTYNLTLYSNDSANNLASQEVQFQVSTTAPAIVLDFPSNLQGFPTTNNILFNFTSTDSDGIDTCRLYSNFTGSWGINETFTSVSSGVQVSTSKNLSENGYIWNVWCNDTLGNSAFALNNLTTYIDLTDPIVTINSITTTPGSQTFTFNSTVDDISTNICAYTIFTSLDQIDGLNDNITFNCNELVSPTTTSADNYKLQVLALDSAGNSDLKNETFSITVGEGGGGGGGSVIIDEAKNWTINVPGELGRLEVSMVDNSKRNFELRFRNDGEESENITLTCEDIEGQVCQYVSFVDESFELFPFSGTDQIKRFRVELPKEIDNGDYSFNIIATDLKNRDESVTVFLGVGVGGFFTLLFIKIFTTFYLWIFIPVLIFMLVGTAILFKKVPGTAIWVLLISFTVTPLIFYFLP